MTETYNGYKNYETWNVCLWVCNEYNVYISAREFAQMNPNITKAMAEEFVLSWYPEGTPDFETHACDGYNLVDWDEVKDCLQEQGE